MSERPIGALGWLPPPHAELARFTQKKVRQHHLVLGRTGAGKSVWMAQLLFSLLKSDAFANHKWSVLDPKGELCSLLTKWSPLFREHGHLSPHTIRRFAPFKSQIPDLNFVLADSPSDEEAALTAMTILESWLDEGKLGARMRPIAIKCLLASRICHGTVFTAASILARDEVRIGIAQRVADSHPHLARYLLDELPREPAQSAQAAHARLAAAEDIPALEAALRVDRCVSADELVNGTPVTILDTSTDSGSTEAASFGTAKWLLHLLLEAAKTRRFRTGDPQLHIVIDEAQIICRMDGRSLENALQTLRWRGISLWILTQDLASFRDHAIQRAVTRNVGSIVHLKPSRPDIIALTEFADPPRGNFIAPSGDRLLKRSELHQAWVDSLCLDDLGTARRARPGIWCDTEARRLVPFYAPSVPVAELDRRAAALPDDVRMAWTAGREELTAAALRNRAVRPEDQFIGRSDPGFADAGVPDHGRSSDVEMMVEL